MRDFFAQSDGIDAMRGDTRPSERKALVGDMGVAEVLA
jgi:hypothetical protein